MSQLTDYLTAHKTHSYWNNTRRVTCADGFEVSVQASPYHYCTPKATVPYDQYSEMEVGYPNQEEELLTPYAEDPEELTQTVYPYVPAHVIEQVIAKHGGVKA